MHFPSPPPTHFPLLSTLISVLYFAAVSHSLISPSLSEWYDQNMPPSFRVVYEELQKLRSIKIRNKHLTVPDFLKSFSVDQQELNEDQKNSSKFYVVKETQGTLYQGQNQLNLPEISQFSSIDTQSLLSRALSQNDQIVFFTPQIENELSPLPEFERPDYQSSVQIYDNWSIFR